jgi:hypothetical protein
MSPRAARTSARSAAPTAVPPSPPAVELPPGLERVARRRILVTRPVVRIGLGPGERALVKAGDSIEAGTPIAERTPDAEVVDIGKLPGMEAADRPGISPTTSAIALDDDDEEAPRRDRRTPPVPGKWWVGGAERRGRPPLKKPLNRVAGTLLFETHGRWRAAVGERHEVVESPFGGVVRDARNCVEITVEVNGSAIPAAIAAGEPSRGYLDVPRLTDGELWASALDVGKSGAVVVAGSRISAQAISRARAMSIRGLVAGSVGQGELRDLAASLARQRASLAPSVPFGLIALDGYQRRPLPTPLLALLAALAGREVAVSTDPPLLVFDVVDVPLPELGRDWVRVRSGLHAGREGRWLEAAGLRRFRGGIYLDAAVVRFVDETDTTILPIADLERFVL